MFYSRALVVIFQTDRFDNKMRYKFSWTFVLILFSTCDLKNTQADLLTAKFIDKGIKTTECLFAIHSDNTYTFKLREFQKYKDETNDAFTGRYLRKGDSIIFDHFDFDYISAETAIIKNNYLEFVGGKKPFKMKIINWPSTDYNGIDTIEYEDYSFFTYDSGFYRIFPGRVNPADLTKDDLVKIESMLVSCVKKRNLSYELKDYFKQCIAVTNQNNEREVWINFICNPSDVEELKYFINWTLDGGDCCFNIKINLDREECYDFWVNAEA
jgi:hypothetical protein